MFLRATSRLRELSWPSPCTGGLDSLYYWLSPYTVSLLPILSPEWWASYTVGLPLYCMLALSPCCMLAFSLYFSLYFWPFSLFCWLSPYTVGYLPIQLAFILYTVGLLRILRPSPILLAFSLYFWLSPGLYLYCWPSPYTLGLLPILLAFFLYCWPSSYTAAFSLHCWPSPYTVGFLPILLAFCWLSSCTVGFLPVLLAISLYCWPFPYTTVGLLPILLANFGLLPIPVLLAFSLYCWPSPYTVGLLPIHLAFSLYTHTHTHTHTHTQIELVPFAALGSYFSCT